MTATAPETIQDSVSPELHLFRAVLAQAFFDATSAAVGKIEHSARHQARGWLLSDSKDFRLVCALALLDFNAVRERAERLAREDWPAPKKEVRERVA